MKVCSHIHIHMKEARVEQVELTKAVQAPVELELVELTDHRVEPEPAVVLTRVDLAPVVRVQVPVELEQAVPIDLRVELAVLTKAVQAPAELVQVELTKAVQALVGLQKVPPLRKALQALR